MKRNDFLRNVLFWGLIAVGLVVVFSNMMSKTSETIKTIDYSNFVQKLHNSQVQLVDINGRTLTGTLNDGEKFITYAPMLDKKIINQMIKAKAQVSAKAPEKPSLFLSFFIELVATIINCRFLYFLDVACRGW